MTYTRALVRAPTPNFALGLTQASEGPPRLDEALLQHRHYCDALRSCGLRLTELAPDPAFPDGTFVEDTALLFPGFAVIARPGAESRRGETASTRAALQDLFEHLIAIEAPGTIDGGDVCVAEHHVYIGLSARTNEAGARQLAALLGARGYTSSLIDIRASATLLHLKSGLTYLGDALLVVGPDTPRSTLNTDYDFLEIDPAESYAANCLNVNGQILIAAGYPHLAEQLEQRGRRTRVLAMSEFRKMDGGLTCLSLRF